MSAQILFVCPDAYFAELFTNYASGAQHDFTLSCFTSEEKALTYYQNTGDQVQAILAPQRFLAQCAADGVLRICLTDFTRCSESAAEVQSLNIYQRHRDILADLQRIVNIHLGFASRTKEHGHTRVMSFFSTQGGAGKSTLAYLTALRAAQDGKAAYLCLEAAPFTDHLYPKPQTAVTGEELIYAIRDRQDPVKAILPALYHNSDNVYVLPAPQSIQDLLELTAEDWEFLVEGLIEAGGLDHIILDLGSELTAVNRMALEHSDLAALVYADDPVGQGKKARLLDDANFPRLGLNCRYIEVRNKCRQKTAATAALVPVPFSRSMDSGVSPANVLANNNDIFAACTQLLQTAAKEV